MEKGQGDHVILPYCISFDLDLQSHIIIVKNVILYIPLSQLFQIESQHLFVKVLIILRQVITDELDLKGHFCLSEVMTLIFEFIL